MTSVGWENMGAEYDDNWVVLQFRVRTQMDYRDWDVPIEHIFRCTGIRDPRLELGDTSRCTGHNDAIFSYVVNDDVFSITYGGR